MNPFRRRHSISTMPSAHPFVWVYRGVRYNFSALNIPDLHSQVRSTLSAQAVRDGFLAS